MKILVCIKQVPDMESRFKINAEQNWYDRSDLVWRMNEYDEYAVEQAVRLKEQVSGSELTVLSIGRSQVQETMKKALAMGCDRGVHIVDEEAHRKDPFEIASIITEFAREQKYDLIFTGMQSQDRGSAQVGVLVAELLGLPSISTIIEFSFADGIITAKRELEGGIKAVVTTGLPALVTCQLGLNVPRYPTLPNIMKAKKKELLSITVETLHQVAPQQEVVGFALPEKKGSGLVLEGDIPALVDQLMKILKDKTTVLA
jgi:electron transfer flavoprotein beta subunit